MNIEKKLTEMGLSLPSPTPPVATYVPAVRTGNLIFVSGHGPAVEEGGKVRYLRGKVGKELSVEQGYEAAKMVAKEVTVKGTLDKEKKTITVASIEPAAAPKK